jgi:hypothetical protein
VKSKAHLYLPIWAIIHGRCLDLSLLLAQSQRLPSRTCSNAGVDVVLFAKQVKIFPQVKWADGIQQGRLSTEKSCHIFTGLHYEQFAHYQVSWSVAVPPGCDSMED